MPQRYGYLSFCENESEEVSPILERLQSIVPEGNLYLDLQSGVQLEQSAFEQMEQRLQPGDKVYISSVSSLGGTLAEIYERWNFLTQVLKAHISVFDFPESNKGAAPDDPTLYSSELVQKVLADVYRKEQAYKKQRSASIVSKAKKNGTQYGRPRKKNPNQFDSVLSAYTSGILSRDAAIQKLNVSQATFYRYLNLYKEKTES